MTDQPTPETDAKLADDPQPSSDSPDYARALEIHIHLLRAELADERAKKLDALIAAVDDIERLTAERDNLSEALERNCVQYVEKQKALIAERDAGRRWWDLETWDDGHEADEWMRVSGHNDEREAIAAGERYAGLPPQSKPCRVIRRTEETIHSWGDDPPPAKEGA